MSGDNKGRKTKQEESKQKLNKSKGRSVQLGKAAAAGSVCRPRSQKRTLTTLSVEERELKKQQIGHQARTLALKMEI